MKLLQNSKIKRIITGYYVLNASLTDILQIRIKVVEARQLQGANISPVTKVACSNQMKATRVQKSTNSPFWNEVFFFNFHSSPAELFDELVTFQVNWCSASLYSLQFFNIYYT